MRQTRPAHDYDAIIVGAGPAGAAAALTLARAGRRVTLLDRAAFPRDKTCGDLLGTWAVQLLRALRIDPAHFTAWPPLAGATLYTPGGHILGADVPEALRGGSNRFGRLDARVVPRLDFDALLVDAARTAGATVGQLQVSDVLCDRQGQITGVIGRREGDVLELRAPLVIGADGWTSVVARAMAVNRGKRQAIGLASRAYADDVRDLGNRMHFFALGRGEGYGWVFPLPDGRANVGLGLVADEPGATDLNALFRRFVRHPSSPARHLLADSTIAGPPKTWPLAFGWRDTPLSAAGLLLAGDAGSLVSPLSGSGIHNALASGISAGRTALEALRRDDFSAAILKAHDRRCRRQLRWRLQVEALAQRQLRDPARFDRLGHLIATMPGAQRLLAPLLLNLG